jgi:hypothetical protein
MTAAERRVRDYAAMLDLIPRRIDTTITSTTRAPSGSQRIAGKHLGGEIHGRFGVDHVPIAASHGEIMIRRPVAQQNRAALLALNETGRWPAAGGGSAGGGAPSVRVFIGQRELTDIVRVEVDSGMDRHDAELDRMVTQGTGAAR